MSQFDPVLVQAVIAALSVIIVAVIANRGLPELRIAQAREASATADEKLAKRIYSLEKKFKACEKKLARMQKAKSR